MWHIIKNGWEDKEFIRQRVYGFEDARKEMEKWNPEEVERVSGVPGEQLGRVAKMFATEKPATLIWCMGQTQHTVGTANVRASCMLLLLTGNVGGPGKGANIFRGHDNVQGANRRRSRYRDTAVLLRPRGRRLEALVARLGG